MFLHPALLGAELDNSTYMFLGNENIGRNNRLSQFGDLVAGRELGRVIHVCHIS